MALISFVHFWPNAHILDKDKDIDKDIVYADSANRCTG